MDAPSAIVTYSPKVFIPLTQLCRDRCGYCTFAQAPAHLDAPYLAPEQVLDVARSGAMAGCHEALITLGESPETRYPQARAWLDDHGFASTIEYVAHVSRLILDETGLLPHVNAGAISRDELELLRTVSPSQGMMIESLNPSLAAHRGAPDKDPERRLQTLEWAGELRIPFTTGILVGIGESRDDRIAALEAIAASHMRHGHVQEVIVQNFIPKPDTLMRNEPACTEADLVDAIALARDILPADVRVQAPPNLVDDAAVLLTAGVEDFGGISPITADHVNPERPWPHLDDLRAVTEAHGKALVPRLTVHARYVRDAETWVDPSLHFAVMDRSDAAGLGRDDPGSMYPEKYKAATNVGTGAEVVIVGRRSTAWTSGADLEPIVLVPGGGRVSAGVREVLDGVATGEIPGIDELVTLFEARGGDVPAIAEFANDLRQQVNGDDVTFVRNRNINYTNVCTFKCAFCGFSKGPASLNLRGRPYLLEHREVAERSLEAWELGATEVCLQGGIHPDFDGDTYVHILEAVKATTPDMHVHGFTALEVTEGARRLGVPLDAYLARLREAGLGSLPGTAAEILDDEVRAVICPDKVSTSEWLECHEIAHSVGLRSNVTIMFGHIERPEHWARHLVRTREVQARTGGFTEFVPLPFVHSAAPLYLKQRARRGPTWRETLLMHAVGRIAYHGFIDNVQASWVKLGPAGVRQLLAAGVNDVGGTLMDEQISRAAGAAHGQRMDADGLAAIVAPLGRPLVQRTTSYDRVNLPMGVA